MCLTTVLYFFLHVRRVPIKESPLILAILENKSVKEIENIINKNPGIIGDDEREGKETESNPLFFAAYMDRTDIVECLIAHGADVPLAVEMLRSSLDDKATNAVSLLKASARGRVSVAAGQAGGEGVSP